MVSSKIFRREMVGCNQVGLLGAWVEVNIENMPGPWIET